MKVKNKNGDFLVCYQVHQVQVYQEICLQVKEWTELDKDLLELAMDIQSKTRIFNAASSFKTNFKIQKYQQNASRFNGVYSRDNLPDKIKDWAYVINLDEYSDIETHQFWSRTYSKRNLKNY